jgi:hypothetical protein
MFPLCSICQFVLRVRLVLAETGHSPIQNMPLTKSPGDGPGLIASIPQRERMLDETEMIGSVCSKVNTGTAGALPVI